MEKRLLIALALAAVVIFISQKLFPAPAAPQKGPVGNVTVTRDTARGMTDTGSAAVIPTDSTKRSTAPDSGNVKPGSTVSSTSTLVDTISVATSKVTYQFSSVGAAPLEVLLADYHKLPKAS